MRPSELPIFLVQQLITVYFRDLQAGGVFVDRAVSSLLQEKLKSSRYGTDEYIARMVQVFEKKVGLLFSRFHN